MADLSTKQWVRYEPGVPGNAELPASERLYFEVCAGLSVMEFQKVRAGIASLVDADPATRPHALALELAGVVRLGAGAHRVNGAPLTALEQYLEVADAQVGQPLLIELFERVKELNSWEGVRALFSVRPSGGTTGTPSVPSQTAAP